MSDQEIRESLCWFDPRYAYFDDSVYGRDETPQPREHDCACGNCFYGRDKLAVALLEMRKAISTGAADIARRCVEAARRVPYIRTHQLDRDTVDYGWTSAPDWYNIENAILAELTKDASNE